MSLGSRAIGTTLAIHCPWMPVLCWYENARKEDCHAN
jgi:hypothetical protein